MQVIEKTEDRHAAALADIREMHTELGRLREENGQLKADLHHEKDRVVLLTDERTRYRTEALVFRSRLIELATAMSNIGLLTVAAQEIVKVVHELDQADTPSTEALALLEKEFAEGNRAA
jgi:FtsZ-binding cell division protein ZapB